MVHRHRHVKKVIRFFSDFAIHIWLILLLANVLLVYTFNFYLQAAPQKEQVSSSLEQPSDLKAFQAESEQSGDSIEEIPTSTPEPTEPPPLIPNGPMLGLSFSVPGIGSAGGNLKPIHPERNVTIYLYPTGVNALDKKVRPLNTITTKAYYDANENSPTYKMFVNPKIDLGAKVDNGSYQIVIKTDKSFRTLIKEKPTNVGGIVYELEKRVEVDEFPILPPQKMIMGDLFPLGEGDNIIDLNDYAVLVNCFQQRRGTPSCPNPYDADLNDDAMVTGLDYNVMVLSYRELQDQGITIPDIVIPPTGTDVSRLSYLTPKVTKAPPTPTPTLIPNEPEEQGGGGIIGLLVAVVFLAMLGGGGFFLYMKNPKVKAMVDGFIPHGKAKVPAAEQQQTQTPTASAQPPAEKTQSPGSNTSAGSPQQSQTTPTTPTSPAQSTDTAKTATSAASAASPEKTEQAKPAESAAPAAPASVSKEYFVKKQSDDETKTGFWLTLTDDNGPQLAHYKGTEVTDGFAQIKGEMKTENGKTFLEISELVPEKS